MIIINRQMLMLTHVSKLAFLYFLLLFSYSTFSNNIGIFDPLCGPKALMAICHEFGVVSNIKNIQDLSWYDFEAGTTMLGLVRASNEIGLPAVPMRINYEKLRKYKSPAIVFVNGNHFTIAWKLDKKSVTLQDWPDPARDISRKEFEAVWNGEALVFSKRIQLKMAKELESSFKPPPGPRIMFPLTHKDKGNVKEGTEISHIFTFVNIGSESLMISSRSSCSCTFAKLSNKLLDPFEQGNIEVSFKTSGRHGFQNNSVQIRTNDPNNRWTDLNLSAFVETSLKVLPKNIIINEVSSGATVIKELKVISPADSSFRITRIDAPSGITAVIGNRKDNNGVVHIPIILTIKVTGPPGEFKKFININTSTSNLKLMVPVIGEILGPLKVIPLVVYLGEVKTGEKLLHEISLNSTNGESFDSIRGETSSKNISVSVMPDGSKLGIYRLLTTLVPSGKDKTIIENISIYINEEKDPALEIPLYARVVASKE